MSDAPPPEFTAAFEAERPRLVALAYRMLGDVARAEDVVQDAWIRALPHAAEIRSPAAFLVKTVTRLCLNELDSAHARREQSRGDRLPEPVDLSQHGLAALESLDQISMAFLVLLQRLTPAERAVLLLHEVFGLDHAEVGQYLGKTPEACRQLLRRARAHVQAQRRSFHVEREEHARLLQQFMAASRASDASTLAAMLTDDASLIADAGPEGGTYGPVRNLPGPVTGRDKVAAFLAAVTPQGDKGLSVELCELNGEPAVRVLRGGAPYAVIAIGCRDGQISEVFIHADPARLGASRAPRN